MIEYLLIALTGVSIALNCVFAFFLTRKSKRSPPQETYDVQALLRDLASGPALVKIEYMDRADVLLRSPRHFS